MNNIATIARLVAKSVEKNNREVTMYSSNWTETLARVEKANQEKLQQKDKMHPNQYYQFERERYIEKKIISLIKKEDITEKEHHTLCFLTQMDLDDTPLVCRDIWMKIPLNYEEFKQKKSDIQIDINDRYSLRDYAFYYKTPTCPGVFLPKNKTSQLNEKIQEKLRSICSEKGYFDDADLDKMLRDNQNDLHKYSPTYRYPTAVECQMEKESANTKVMDWGNNYELHKEATAIRKDLEDSLQRIICCVRHAEYSNDSLFEKLEMNLAKKLMAMDEEAVFGFELLKKPGNTKTKEEIQNKLNQFLLRETNLERIAYWISKGADINAVNEEGLTILGIYLKNPRHKELNVSVPRMISLGIDVNVGIDRESQKNNLMLAFRNHRPEISDDTINLLIEHSTFATINYRQKQGTALHYAIFSDSDRPDCVKKLVNKGASLNLTDESGNTPLIIAVDRNHYPAVKLILNSDSKTLDYQDKDGNTALMRRVRECYWGRNEYTTKIIDLLISSGANLDIVNVNGKTARELAAWNTQIAEQYNHSVEQLQSMSFSLTEMS